MSVPCGGYIRHPDALGPVDGRLRPDDATDPDPLLRRTALLHRGHNDNRPQGIDLFRIYGLLTGLTL